MEAIPMAHGLAMIPASFWAGNRISGSHEWVLPLFRLGVKRGDPYCAKLRRLGNGLIRDRAELIRGAQSLPCLLTVWESICAICEQEMLLHCMSILQRSAIVHGSWFNPA